MGNRAIIRFINKNNKSKKQLYFDDDASLSYIGKHLYDMMIKLNHSYYDDHGFYPQDKMSDIIHICEYWYVNNDHNKINGKLESTQTIHENIDFTYTVIIHSNNKMEIDIGFKDGKSQCEINEKEHKDKEFYQYFMNKPDKKYSRGFITRKTKS